HVRLSVCALPHDREGANPPPSPSPCRLARFGLPARGSHWTSVQLDCTAPARNNWPMSEHAWLQSELRFRPPGVPAADMIRIPGATFRMGSDKHYPEEAPVHRVTVGDFQIDRTPITNRQFREFVKATRHVTFAEIPPDPKDYPGAPGYAVRGLAGVHAIKAFGRSA